LQSKEIPIPPHEPLISPANAESLTIAQRYEFCCLLGQAIVQSKPHWDPRHWERVMKNLIVFLVLIVVVILGAGLYLNWFSFSSTSSDGSTNFNMQVDKAKIEADKQKAKQKFQETTKDLQDKINSDKKQ
jgi:hypothetical protein